LKSIQYNNDIIRSNESLEDYKKRLTDQQSRNLLRCSQSQSQNDLRLEKQRLYAREKRAKETEQERMIRLQLEKQKRIDKKYNVSTLKIAANRAIDIDTLNVGAFNLECPHCGSLYNPLEANSKGVYMRCCENGN